MPQVPTVDSFQVIPQARAKSVEFVNTPYQDDAYKKLGRLSAEFNRFALQIRDRQDEAMVTDKVTNYKRWLIDQTYGDNGYTKLKEQNALQPDDQGRSLAQRYEAGNTDYANELMKDMNPRQQEKFRAQIMPLDNSFHQGALSYTLGEADQYNDRVFKGYLNTQADLAAQYAGDPSLVMQARQEALDKITEHAKQYGWGEEAIKSTTADFTSKFWSGALSSYLQQGTTDPRGTAQALAVLNKYKNEISPQVAVQARTMIQEQQARQDYNQLTNAWIGGSMAQTSPSVRAVRALEGVPGFNSSSSTSTFAVGSGGGRSVPMADTKVVNPSGKPSAVEGAPAVVSTSAAPAAVQGKAEKTTFVTPQQNSLISGVMGRLGPDTALRVFVASQERLGKTVSAQDRDNFLRDYQSNKGTQDYIEGIYLGALVSNYAGDADKAITARLLGKSAVDTAIGAAMRAGKPDQWADYLTEGQKQVMPQVRKVVDRFNTAPTFYNVGGEQVSSTSPEGIYASFGIPQPHTDAQLRAIVLANDRTGVARANPSVLLQRMGMLRQVEARRIAEQKENISTRVAQIQAEVKAAGGRISRISSQSQIYLVSNPAVKASITNWAKRLAYGDNNTDMTEFVRRFDNLDYLRNLSENQFLMELQSVTTDPALMNRARDHWFTAQGLNREADQYAASGNFSPAIIKTITTPAIKDLMTNRGWLKNLSKDDATAYVVQTQMGIARYLTARRLVTENDLEKLNLGTTMDEYMAANATFGGRFWKDPSKPLSLVTWQQAADSSSNLPSDIKKLVATVTAQNLQAGQEVDEVSQGNVFQKIMSSKSPAVKVDMDAMRQAGFEFSQGRLNDIAETLSSPGVNVLPVGTKGEDLLKPGVMPPADLLHFYLLSLMDASLRDRDRRASADAIRYRF